jgi:hypothetical protein
MSASTVKGALKVNLVSNATKTEYRAEFVNLKGKLVSPAIMAAAQFFAPAKAKDGDAITVELDRQQNVIKVTIDGQPEVKPAASAPAASSKPNSGRSVGNRAPQSSPSRQSYQGGQSYRQSSASSPSYSSPIARSATAPYNFIPYDLRKIVLSNYDPKNPEANGPTYSGTVRCRLKALTPLLVAGPGLSGREEKSKERTFLEVNGRQAIPGSSLKGLLRSLVETLRFSALTQINDNTPVYRNFQMSEYRELMGTNDERRSMPGWLVAEGAEYKVIPVALGDRGDSTTTSVKVKKFRTPTEYTEYLFNHWSTSETSLPIDAQVYNDFAAQLVSATQEGYLDERFKLNEKLGVKGLKKLQEGKRLPVFYVICNSA